MNDLNYAIDAYMDALARLQRSKETRRTYLRVLFQLSDFVGDVDCDEITPEMCRRFLDRWVDASPSTLALHVSILVGFFEFLIDQTVLADSPMRTIRRPARKRPEDLDVVTIASSDVERMFAACVATDELVCIAFLAYTGVRRTALANLRRRDLDLDQGYVRFREKGRKVIVKPIPDELLAMLRELDADGEWVGPEEYVVRNRRPTRESGVRSSKVIYRIVTDVAKRARVRSHVHALRAAFAVRYLESPEGKLEGLKELLGHSRVETTMVYLRRLDKQRAMESVRGLSWSSALPSSPGMPPTGFEPVLPASPVPEPLRRKLDELRAIRATREARR